jgi:hypothetical protein
VGATRQPQWQGRSRLGLGAGSQAGQAVARGKAVGEEEIEGHNRTFRGGLRNKTRKDKGRVFIFLKINQTNEFKHTFEFKRSKTMHLHVCNNKLLYFII